MKKKRFSVEQMVGVLKQAEVGVPVAEVIRKAGISEQTFYRWKAKYAGHWFLDLKEARRLIEAWRREYNDSRPHASLDDRTPSEFASQRLAAIWLQPKQVDD